MYSIILNKRYVSVLTVCEKQRLRERWFKEDESLFLIRKQTIPPGAHRKSRQALLFKFFVKKNENKLINEKQAIERSTKDCSDHGHANGYVNAVRGTVSVHDRRDTLRVLMIFYSHFKITFTFNSIKQTSTSVQNVFHEFECVIGRVWWRGYSMRLNHFKITWKMYFEKIKIQFSLTRQPL